MNKERIIVFLFFGILCGGIIGLIIYGTGRESAIISITVGFVFGIIHGIMAVSYVICEDRHIRATDDYARKNSNKPYHWRDIQ